MKIVTVNSKRIFQNAIDAFFVNEKENILNNVAERNLCARLSIYLTDELRANHVKNYYVDTEYNRKQGGQVKTIIDGGAVITIQCDLIVHSRGNLIKDDNLIAIEMKKSNRPAHEKEADRRRLRIMTMTSYDGVWSADGVTHPEHVCGYEMGVYMILNISKQICHIELYKSGDKIDEIMRSF